MKTFILFLFGVTSIGLYFFVKPVDLQRFTNISNLLESSVREANPGDGPAQPVRVNRTDLVGVWLSEDRREILMLREDGKSRRAMAYNLDGGQGNHIQSATIKGVYMGEWALNDSNNALIFKNETLKDFKALNPKIDMSGVNVAASRKIEAYAQIKTWVEETLQKELEHRAGKELASQPITGKSADKLVLERGIQTIPFDKIEIAQARDPDGVGVEPVENIFNLTLDVTLGDCGYQRTDRAPKLTHY